MDLASQLVMQGRNFRESRGVPHVQRWLIKAIKAADRHRSTLSLYCKSLSLQQLWVNRQMTSPSPLLAVQRAPQMAAIKAGGGHPALSF